MTQEGVIKSSIQSIMQMNEQFERTGRPFKVKKGKLAGIGARER